MARASITYEQVAAVANALYASGNHDPGTKAVRDELAKRAGPGMPVGSPNTVQRHLGVWREKARPVDPPAPAPQLPPQLATDISRALNAAAAAVREEADKRLAQVKAELQELAENGENHEAQIEELAQTLAARTSERDTLAGQLKEQVAEVQALKAAVEREQATAEGVRLDLAKAQIKVETADARVAEAMERENALRADLANVGADLANERTARAEADRRADVAGARLDAEREVRGLADARVLEVQTKLQSLEVWVGRAAAAEAAVAELRAQVGMLQDLLAKATGDGKGTVS